MTSVLWDGRATLGEGPLRDAQVIADTSSTPFRFSREAIA